MPNPSPSRKKTTKEIEQQSEPSQHIRLEMRWSVTSRELEDLSRLAGQIKGNSNRRGEASSYVIHLWSRVIHGELSPSAFWEMFGVTTPTPAPNMYPGMMPMPGMYPGMMPMPGMIPATPSGYDMAPEPPAPQEDPEVAAKKAKRAKNRAAQADQWSE